MRLKTYRKPTLAQRLKRLLVARSGWEYFGIPLPTETHEEEQ